MLNLLKAMPDTDTVDSCMNTSVTVWRPGWFPTVTWSEDVRRWFLVPGAMCPVTLASHETD